MSKLSRTESQAAAARDAARNLHAEGVDLDDIARRLQTYGRVVRFWLGMDGSGWDYESIMALRNRGVPISAIATTVEVPRNYIWHTIGSRPRREETVVRQVRLNRRSWERLPAICDQLGVRKLTGDAKPSNSVARLLDGIADGHLTVAWVEGKSPDTVDLGIK